MFFRQFSHAAVAAVCLLLAAPTAGQTRPAAPPRPTAVSLFQRALEAHEADPKNVACFQFNLGLAYYSSAQLPLAAGAPPPTPGTPPR